MRLLLVTILFLPSTLWSSFDYGLSSNARSYPIAASLEGNVGYNKLVWGDEKTLMYGYLRPNVTLSEVGRYHAGNIAIEFFPISFFKISTGLSREESNTNPSKIDCDSIECQGQVNHRYIESILQFGFKDYIGSIGYRLDQATHPNGTHSFMDYETTIPMSGHKDQTQKIELLLGRELSDQWTLLYALEKESSLKAKGRTDAHYLIGAWAKGPWEIGGGAGAFHATLLDWGFSSIVWLSWSGGKSLDIKKH